jgi:hypothetical protein
MSLVNLAKKNLILKRNHEETNPQRSYCHQEIPIGSYISLRPCQDLKAAYIDLKKKLPFFLRFIYTYHVNLLKSPIEDLFKNKIIEWDRQKNMHRKHLINPPL